MRSVMGVIHHLKNEEALGEITRHRCIAAVPYGGRYRLVDFVLSNMVNAGINNIGIITSLNMRSLLDHLGNGKEWGLDKKHDGLFILPAAKSGDSKNRRKVDMEDFYANLDYLERSRQDYVIVSGSNMVCKLDYQEIVRYHKDKRGDITIVYKEDYPFYGDDLEDNMFLEIETAGRVMSVSGRPKVKKRYRVSMDMYVMAREFLLDLLKECEASRKWDLVRDILAKRLQELRVYGFQHQGYLAIINTVFSYYRHHFELLNPAVWEELFLRRGVVYTKLRDGPPSRYADISEVRNTLVANGCRIEGKVENSILYRDVNIAKGAVVRNSIVMSKTEIAEDVLIDRAILDKEVQVKKGTWLVGEKNRPVVVGKKSVV